MVKIKTKDLRLKFGDKEILKGISIDIPENSVVAVIGPSGCGKSTFVRSLNRMNDFIKDVKISGKVYLDGKDIYEQNVNVFELRKRVGMIFQKPNPFPKSIYENIAYGLKIHGIKDRRIIQQTVEESLKDANLWEEVKDKLFESAFSISGGQQQRLCTARALAIKPEVILMDEPASALDPIATNKLEHLIEKLKKDYTIVIVTHNIQQAARISDYTAFLYMGELIEYGKTKMMFTAPRNKRTEEYIMGKFS